MKATLKLNGKDYEVEISEEQANAIENLDKPKKTGYERVKASHFYYVEYDGIVDLEMDMGADSDNNCYDIANYYSDKTVAENNARADALMRKLRRFAVEHRTKELDWNDSYEEKRCIAYDHETKQLINAFNQTYQAFGETYFDSKETAEAAIEEFHDELLWYFTEYRDSL